MMSRQLITALSLAAASLLGSPVVQAQTAPVSPTRAQVKMDRDAFLAMVRWDEMLSQWVLRSNMEPPAGITPRSEVMAMRDRFLSLNAWDEILSQWVPVKGAPRDMNTLPREQVQVETLRFLMMYRFDEASSRWISKAR